MPLARHTCSRHDDRLGPHQPKPLGQPIALLVALHARPQPLPKTQEFYLSAGRGLVAYLAASGASLNPADLTRADVEGHLADLTERGRKASTVS